MYRLISGVSVVLPIVSTNSPLSPILELTRLTVKSGHRLTVCYDSFSETRFIVDVLEVSPERTIGVSLR